MFRVSDATGATKVTMVAQGEDLRKELLDSSV